MAHLGPVIESEFYRRRQLKTSLIFSVVQKYAGDALEKKKTTTHFKAKRNSNIHTIRMDDKNTQLCVCARKEMVLQHKRLAELHGFIRV